MIKGTWGRGGSGKSLVTVSKLWKEFCAGRDIISNTPLIDLAVKRFPNPNRTYLNPSKYIWMPLSPKTFGRSWAAGYVMKFEDVYDLDNCECLIDEMGAWMPNHKWKTIPDEVRRFLAQDRREGVNLWWTHRTTRIFNDVLDNTAAMTFCQRWGPVVIARTYDPEEKTSKGSKTFHFVRPSVFQRYDTYAKVGDPEKGDGYGKGKRALYSGSGNSSGFHYTGYLETVTGDRLGFDIALSEGQAEALVRVFGPEVVGIHRLGARAGALQSGRKLPGGCPLVKYGKGPNVLPQLLPYPS
jgi:hypothetical protein